MSALTGLSFYALDEASQQEVLAAASSLSSDQKLPETMKSIDGRALVMNRLQHEEALKYANQFVDGLVPLGFPYLSEAKAKFYENELTLVYYLALADCKLGVYDRNPDKYQESAAFLHQVATTLNQLRHRHNPEVVVPEPQVAPLKQNSLELAKDWVAHPASFNDGRLYLVWLAEMLTHICTLIKRALDDIKTVMADFLIDVINELTGAMGWILYFMRGGVETGLLIQNTVDMRETCLARVWPDSLQISEELSALNVPFEARWRSQWKARSGIILNDAAWGIVNFVCFFILYASGPYGYWGDVLNAALFIFDLWHTSKILREVQADFDAELARFDDAIAELRAAIKLAGDDEHKRAEALQGIEKLQKARSGLIRNWQYELKANRLEVAYAFAVVIAFAVLCAFYVPTAFSASGLLTMALIGSAACFLLGVVYEAWGSALKLEYNAEEQKATRQDFGKLLALFISLDTQDDDQKKLLFLEIYQVVLALQELQIQRQHDITQMWTNGLTDLLIPVLFVVTLVLMPQTIGVPAFALGVAAVLFGKWKAGRAVEEADAMPEEFPEQAYERFCEAVSNNETAKPQQLLCFFKLDKAIDTEDFEEQVTAAVSPAPA